MYPTIGKCSSAYPAAVPSRIFQPVNRTTPRRKSEQWVNRFHGLESQEPLGEIPVKLSEPPRKAFDHFQNWEKTGGKEKEERGERRKNWKIKPEALLESGKP
ncbi:hypothetical protein AVEN_262298-1 [Araneus ventricosus]|uniref:Uncharacterized protein n=1 Tax=Araneus ventricosus TaxID=182803 RepID=A0A4Y2KF86_ARAVE|nr:hypothetical protein AVEN_262298-1 [Araneus ventricosus]